MGNFPSCWAGRAKNRFKNGIFSKYDKDGSGEMDVSQIQALFTEDLGEPLPEEELKVLFEELDADKNGTVGVNELRAFRRHYDRDTRLVHKKSALIIIDVQNDFIGGSLANPYNAVEIVPIINSIRDSFDLVVVSYDWHPAEHCSFVESVNAGKVPIKETGEQFPVFSKVTLLKDKDREEHQQVLYPRHAVMNTEGSQCHKDLRLNWSSDKRVNKGTRPNIDSYSAFFDNCKANDTGLQEILEEAGITDIYCCGLVFDICVKSSALHGAELGFITHVIEDACRPLSVDNVSATKVALDEAGVQCLSSQESVAKASKMKSIPLKEYLAGVRKHKKALAVHSKQKLGAHARGN